MPLTPYEAHLLTNAYLRARRYILEQARVNKTGPRVDSGTGSVKAVLRPTRPVGSQKGSG